MKKTIQHLLSYSLLAACLTSTQASMFRDVPTTHWAYPFVSQAEESNLVSGVGDGLFSPDTAMTYGQFSVMICNGAYEGKISTSIQDTHWADGYFRQLYTNKLFDSSDVDDIIPTDGFLDAPITRETVSIVLANLLTEKGFEAGPLSLAEQFSDVSSLSIEGKQSIATMVFHGIMTGDDQGNFGLGTSLTRGQASVLVKNMLDQSILTPIIKETPENQSTSVHVEERTEFDLANLQDAVLETAGLTGDTILATSNGYAITAAEVFPLVAAELDNLYEWSMYGLGDIPWGEEIEGGPFETVTLRNALELALLYQIIFQVAKDEGISLPQDFHDSLQEYLDGILDELGGNETHYQYVLWQAMVTEEQYKGNSQANELYNMIFDKYFSEGGTRAPDDATLLQYMAEQGYYSVKHILISTNDDEGNQYNAAEKAKALAKAQGILADLQASKDLATDFHTQMLAYSEDPGSHSSPEGYTATLGQMVTEFETASLLLEENTMSAIVESSFGYHIIYRLPLTPTDSVRSEYASEEAIAMQEQWLADNPLVIHDLFHQIDLQQFYRNLTVLRKQTHAYLD